MGSSTEALLTIHNAQIQEMHPSPLTAQVKVKLKI